MILQHTFHIQVFGNNDLVFVHYFPRQFVLKVFSLILDLFVKFSEFKLYFLVVLAKFLTFA